MFADLVHLRAKMGPVQFCPIEALEATRLLAGELYWIAEKGGPLSLKKYSEQMFFRCHYRLMVAE